MRKIYIAAAALLLGCTASFGQSINPTVEVTNSYDVNSSEISKPQMNMNIPDSLLRFDLDFTYEVFDKPYEGSYSFRPYYMDMRPEADAWRAGKFFMKLGAGYSLHPEFELVYSPLSRGAFALNLHASHKSFFGTYNEIGPEADGSVSKLKSTGNTYNGRDALTSAGIDGTYSWQKAEFSFNLGYDGVSAKDWRLSDAYNGADFGIRIRTKEWPLQNRHAQFHANAGISGKVGGLNFNYDEAPAFGTDTKYKMTENIFKGDAEIGFTTHEARSYLLGIEGESVSYGGGFYDGSMTRFALIPKYGRQGRLFDISLGLRLELVGKNNPSDTELFQGIRGNGNLLYPDVHIDFKAGRDVTVYFSATGGNDLNAYSSWLSSNRHLDPAYFLNPSMAEAGQNAMLALHDNTSTQFDVRLGIRGDIGSKLQFDVRGGVEKVKRGLVSSAMVDGYGEYLPIMERKRYNVVFAGVLLEWKSGNVSADLDMKYRKMSFNGQDALVTGFKLPEFTADFRFMYSFGPRAYAGLLISGVTSREGRCAVLGSDTLQKVTVPGYVDLGLAGGYKVNRKLSAYLKCGNLAGMSIQRVPFYAEKGPWFTVGICLSL